MLTGVEQVRRTPERGDDELVPNRSHTDCLFQRLLVSRQSENLALVAYKTVEVPDVKRIDRF